MIEKVHQLDNRHVEIFGISSSRGTTSVWSGEDVRGSGSLLLAARIVCGRTTWALCSRRDTTSGRVRKAILADQTDGFHGGTEFKDFHGVVSS